MPTRRSKAKSSKDESWPERAKRLIAKNKRTKAKFLYLGQCGLTRVPDEVGELVWLESLSLSDVDSEWDGRRWKYKSRSSGRENPNSGLRDLVPLAGLSGLRVLQVSATQVSDLTPLAGLLALQSLDVSNTQVRDLAPLAGLSAMQELDFRNTKVDDLAPLAGLSALLKLNIGGTRVSDLAPLAGLCALRELLSWETQITDLAPLARLAALQTLYLRGTQVRDLAPLAGLSALRELGVSDSKITDLAPLAGLLALQTLDISHTQVTDLSPLIDLIKRGRPVKWSSNQWREGDGVYVEDCPLTNPPSEIAKQGNEAILNYFRERVAGGVDHLYEAKMLILGEGGAGKTSLLRRLYQPTEQLPTEAETTRGINIFPQEFQHKSGRKFRLNVWDFGGQQIYHATHQFFLTHRSLYVLVDDTRKDYKAVTDEGFKSWLDLIEVFGGDSPTLIFQNEKDGRSKQIDIRGIQQRYNNVKEVYKGDLIDPHAADGARDGIEFYASHLSHIGEEVPARWLRVREDIEARAAQIPYVAQQEYFDIYRRHINFDRTAALHLSQYLHDLGVFLHFQDDPLLARTVILQNEWATKAVFRILDDERVKGKVGRFTNDDCQRLWPDDCYLDMHVELLALMQKFELCYDLPYSEPKTWLAPQLLPAGRPSSLAGSRSPDDLVLRYRYDFLPKGMISRLTVRQHRFVRNPEKAWISGVFFERDSSSVLVEILPSGLEIELRARGPEHKALLSVIAADLDALNESFQGLRGKVDKRIPCNCSVCRAATDPEFFDQKDLLSLKERGRLKWPCKRSFEDVDVQQLLDGIKLEKPPAWAKEESPSRSLRIFLASSSELREERDEFELYFRQQNDSLSKDEVNLAIVRWENFLDAMSETRLQDEYNQAIRECDVFVSLFFTKTGKFTEEEFDTAHAQFKNSGRPLIYTYFKNADIKIGSARKEDLNSRWAFQEKVGMLGHFYTEYENIEGLKLHFRGQIEKILERLKG